MRNNDYSKLKSLSNYVEQIIRTGKWNLMSAQRQKSLSGALSRLVDKLKGFIAKRKLVRILGAAVLIISSNANAQSFIGPETDPFGIEHLDTYIFNPEFIDIDGDGDLDYFISDPAEEKFIYQENIGTATEPEFGEPVINPFGLEPISSIFLTLFGDLDDDGDLDFLATNYDDGSVIYYENTGTVTEPNFGTETAAPFGLSFSSANLLDLVDIDDDGDLDLFTSVYDTDIFTAVINYVENTGTSTMPAFTSPEENPFGIDLGPDEYFSYINFADLDEDGDLDFIRTQLYGITLYYHENNGSADSPEFTSGDGINSPFGIPPLPMEEGYFFAPVFADIDGDGDFDVFVSQYDGDGSTYFYENTTYVGIEDNYFERGEITLSPNPATDNILLKTELTNEEIVNVSITTLDGRIVYHSEVIHTTIEISDFTDGLYLLEIRLTNGNIERIKFIKK